MKSIKKSSIMLLGMILTALIISAGVEKRVFAADTADTEDCFTEKQETDLPDWNEDEHGGDAVLKEIVVGEEFLEVTDEDVYEYSVEVEPETKNAVVTGVAKEKDATVKTLVGGKEVKGSISLKTGENEVYLLVLSDDGTVSLYTLNIVRREKSSDATLSGIAFSAGNLASEFDKEKTSYNVYVTNDVEMITVLPAVSEKHASVQVNRRESDEPVELIEGLNRVEIAVTAEDGTKNLYHVVINRLAKEGELYPVGSLVYQVTSATAESRTVTVIGDNGDEFADLQIPNSVSVRGILYKVTAVAPKAFYQKTSLKTVTVGENVAVIGDSAFKDCGSLKTVTIGKGLMLMESKVFSKDLRLTTLTIKSSKLETVGINALYRVKNVTIKVPKAKVTLYKKIFKEKKAVKYCVVKI